MLKVAVKKLPKSEVEIEGELEPEIFESYFAKALKKMGHEPYVISNGGVLVNELIKAGIPHLTLPVHKKSIMSLRLVGTIASPVSNLSAR